MQITCPQCNSILAEEHINHKANIVTCNVCQSVFSTPDKDPDAIARRNRKVPVQPVHFSLQTNDGTALIAYDDIDNRNKFVIVLGIISTVAMIYIFWSTANQSINNDFALFFSCFLFLWFLTNIGLGIIGFRLAYNRITITINKETLMVYNQPIRFPSPIYMDTKEINQLFVKENRGKHRVIYGVYVKTHYDKIQAIATGFKNPAYALFIEHQIEKFLRIRDSAVEDEFSSSPKKASK